MVGQIIGNGSIVSTAVWFPPNITPGNHGFILFMVYIVYIVDIVVIVYVFHIVYIA